MGKHFKAMLDTRCCELYISKLSEDVHIPVHLASRIADSKLDVLHTETHTLWLCAREFQK